MYYFDYPPPEKIAKWVAIGTLAGLVLLIVFLAVTA